MHGSSVIFFLSHTNTLQTLEVSPVGTFDLSFYRFLIALICYWLGWFNTVKSVAISTALDYGLKTSHWNIRNPSVIHQ